MNSTVDLRTEMFTEIERPLLRAGDLSLSTFTYPSGVHAVRLKNKNGEIILLPFQGQQIWRCRFLGHDLTMRSAFQQPRPTLDYLGTYGGFLLHCGATVMGVPGPEDTHPLHGELPNAPYDSAAVSIEEDEGGASIVVSGSYEHISAFNSHYIARPGVRLREDATVVEVKIDIENKRQTPMDLMYMMHVNFRPEDFGELVYSAFPNPEQVKVHVSVPSHMKSAGIEDLVKYMHQLESNPTLHHLLDPKLPYNPEIVFTIRYESDPEGYAHALMVHPDGYGSYLSFRPEELEFGIRWISRTGTEDALGMVLPATAEHQGYTAEKKKGHLKSLAPGDTVSFHAVAGLLSPQETKQMRENISEILREK